MRPILLYKLAVEFEKAAAKKALKYEEFEDGIVINADSCDPETFEFVKKWLDGEKIAAILIDPPYGINVKSLNNKVEEWDKIKTSEQEFVDWMFEYTKLWWDLLISRGAFWMFGGIGLPKLRPFFQYILQAEHRKDMDMYLAELVCIGKRRGFGSQKRLLFTREELVYFIKADKHNPRVFNVPYLKEKRPYAGFNKLYPALSEFYRRSNVWSDMNELFSKKIHSCQKPLGWMQVPIEISTKPKEIILDFFAGSGSSGFAARNCGRRFILIEQDPAHYKNIVARMKTFKPGDKV